MFFPRSPRSSRPSWPRCRQAGWLALALLAAGCSPPRLPEEPFFVRERRPLGPQQVVGVATYRLEKGEYLRAVAAPAGFDVALSLETPDGAGHDPARRAFTCARTPLTSDAQARRGFAATEEIAWVAEVKGTYHLTLCSFSDRPGTVDLSIWGTRRPSPSDRLRARAVTASLWAEKTTDGLASPEEWRERLARIEGGPEAWSGFDEPQRLADIHFYVGNIQDKLGRPDLALSALGRAVALYGRVGNAFGEAEARSALALLRKRRGELEAAKAEIDRALAKLAAGVPTEQVPPSEIGKAAAVLLSNRGNLKIDLAQLGGAIADLREAARLFEANGDKRGQSLALAILGATYEGRSDWQNAREAYERSLELAEESMDSVALAQALHGMAAYFMAAGAYARASGLLERSIDLQRRWPTSDLSRSLNNLGRALFLSGQAERARRSYHEGLELLDSLPGRAGDRETRVHLLNNLAVLDFHTGAPERALARVRQALSLARDDEPVKLICLEIEGIILRRMKDLPAARRSAEKALALEPRFDSPFHRGAILLLLAHLELDSGSPARSLERIEQAQALVESSRSQLLGEAERSAHLASRREYFDVHIAALLALGRHEEALAVSEGARARSLLETLGARRYDLQEGGDPALAGERRSLLESVQDANFRVAKLRARRAPRGEVRQAEEEVSRRWTELSEVEDRMRAKSPRYAALTRPEPLAARDIRRLVADGDALLLEYWLGEERTVIWAVTAEDVELLTVAEPRVAVEKRARCFYEGLVSPGPDATGRPAGCRAAERAAAGAWLSEKLLAPVADLLASRRDRPLLVVADGALQVVPFAALPDPAAPRDYLLARHAVVNLPSASVLAALREKPKRVGPSNAIVFADPVFRADDERVHGATPAAPVPESVSRDAVSRWARLTATRQEADEIRRLLPPGRCRVVRDFEASTDTVKRLDLTPYRMIHFATHGDVNSEVPSLSRLVLSAVDERGRPRPEFLYLYDVYNLRLDADLVVLSACNTALGQEIRGEGLIGLTRGFLYAGARSVVASLWSVDSAATKELMVDFYRFLVHGGLPPAEALRAAQLEMARSKRSAPFYWAGFTLQGEWR